MKENAINNELVFRYTKIYRMGAKIIIILIAIITLIKILVIIDSKEFILLDNLTFLVLIILFLPQAIKTLKYKVIIGTDNLIFADNIFDSGKFHVLNWDDIESVEYLKKRIIITAKPINETIDNHRENKSVFVISYTEKRDELFQEIIKRTKQAEVINHNTAVTG